MDLYSISLHNGTKWSRIHNIRGGGLAEKEEHIDPNGYRKTLIDVPLKESYHQTFGQAILEYNAKQTRSDRHIVDYLAKVKDEHKRSPTKKPHASYEMILTIGNKDHHPPVKRAEKALKNWLEEFQSRNPNVVVFGAYFHADEPDSAPHMHVDYYFVKRENKRGMSLQVSQNGALNEQGYFPRKENGKFLTPQTQWQYDSRELLRSIAKENHLFVEEAKRGQSHQHLDTDLFKKKTKLDRLNKEIEQVKDDLDSAVARERAASRRVELKEKRVKELEQKEQELDEVITNAEWLEMRNRVLERENSLLKRSLALMKEAINGLKACLKGYNVEKVSLWKKAKDYLFNYLGKSKYDDWQAVRHELSAEEKVRQAMARRKPDYDLDR